MFKPGYFLRRSPIFILLLLVWSLINMTSCLKRYIPEEEKQSDVITLLGFVSPDTVYVQIMYLAPLKPIGYESEFVVPDIEVILMENNQVFDTLITENGIDFTLSTPKHLDPGIPYYLRIIRRNQILVFTDPVNIPAPLVLDTLTERMDNKLELKSIIRELPAEYLYVNASHRYPLGKGLRYNHNVPRFINFECWLSSDSPIRKSCLEINNIDTLKIGLVQSHINSIPGDTIYYSFRGVDEWYFHYYKTLKQSLDVEFGTQEPVPAKGNVHGGFGILAAYNELVYKVHK